MRNQLNLIGLVTLTILIAISVIRCGGGDGDGGIAIICGDNEAVYVRMDADDSNPGTISEPLQTIQAAVACAVSGQSIRIANGTYVVDSVNGSNIRLEEGKSIYGGYSSDFQVRDPVVYPTIINDVTDMTMFPQYQASVVSVGTTTLATVLDGLTINGSTVGSSGSVAAIYITNGTPTISNNIINGGGSSNLSSCGVDLSSGGGVIKNNTITANEQGIKVSVIFGSFEISKNTISANYMGVGIHAASTAEYKINNNTISSDSYGVVLNDFSIAVIEANTISAGTGIHTTKGAPVIRNNTIKFTGVGGEAAGISNRAHSVISNNTIVGGSNLSSGIYTTSTSTILQNNIIDMVDGICIAEGDANSDPASLQNNDLTGCSTLYCDEGWDMMSLCAISLTNISDVNALVETAASGNISIPPNLDGSQDYRLTGASPIEVTQGGLDLSSDFNTDKAGYTRTVPWSMGAYEYD